MRERNFILWAVVCGAVVACSNADAGPALKPVRPGPAAPELGWRESPERVERAPISLTASDGSGLALVSLEARTVIEDPLAFTELHLTFHNPEPRRREGRFEIVLPQNAAISRFAMRVAGGWQEGEVVERRRAQQVYEDFLHRKQDPALLEKDAGNEFAARVFPIEAGADKEIILAYSEERTRRDQPYVLLLGGLPQLSQLDVEVRFGSNSATGRESAPRARGTLGRLRLSERDFAPEADLEIRLPWQKPVALRSGELVVARVAPEIEPQPATFSGLTVLFDTSASRALGFGAQVERLGALLAALRERSSDFDLRVVAFDQTAEEVYRGPAGGFGVREQAELIERDALGATDLAQALAFVARGAARHERVLLIGDGVLTAGADDTTALREAVAALAAHGARRFDVLAEGGIQDRDALTALTRAGLPSTGVVLDARTPVGELADRLLRGTRERVDVHIAGATFVHPKSLYGLQPGDEALVFAELPAGAPLQIELAGAGAEAFETMEVPRPLLERALARAKIAALSAELRALRPDAAAERAELEREIVALSLRHRVVSDYTALLVLETAADYARFGIAQNALASILRVGDEGIELFDRSELVMEADEPPALQIAAEEQEGSDDRAEHLLEGRAPAGAPRDLRANAPAEEPSATTGLGAPPPAQAERMRTRRSAGPGEGFAARGAEPMKRSATPAAKPAARDAERASRPVRSAVPAMAAPAAAAPRPAPAAPSRASAKVERAEAAPRSPVPAAAVRGGAPEAEPSADGAVVPPEYRTPGPTRLQIAAPPRLEARADVRLSAASGVDQAAAASVLRGALRTRARQCYERAAARGTGDRLVLEIFIGDKGTVTDVRVAGGTLADARTRDCIAGAARALRFPKPEAGSARVRANVALAMVAAADPPQPDTAARPRPRTRPRIEIPRPALEDAYEGVLASVLAALAQGDRAAALARATAARAEDPGSVVHLIALGEALEAQQDYPRAARAYGSLIDLFPSRADLRRMAAARLERLPEHGLALAADSYRRAVEQRPDHPSGHRALAYALWKRGERAAAFETLERALELGFAPDRFEGVERILREDLSLLGAAWVRAEPDVEARVTAALAARGLSLDRTPSLRFVLSWETDANDVDFHVYDGKGGHAYYMKPKLPAGGALYADITTGYGPECFTIPGRTRHYPYVLQAHYFARGPMGYGMGKLQVVEHDGAGGLRFAEHPFVIMKDKAFVELARIERPLG